jgi:hypothetical protein
MKNIILLGSSQKSKQSIFQTKPTSTYRLIYRALDNDGNDSFFSNKTEREEPDKVYGRFLYRRLVLAADCQRYSKHACPFKKDSIIWHDQ